MDWPAVPSAFTLGVLMLDTRFPRPVGDIGNAETFPFKVLYHTVPRAVVGAVVTNDEIPRLLADAFVEGAVKLVDEGADLISTSCGFLSVLQDRLASEIDVPAVTSALNLLPDLCGIHGPGATIGVITFDSTRLSQHHLPAMTCSVIVEGVESGTEIHDVVTNDRPHLDMARAETDAVDAARRLLDRAPDLSAIVLECTNLAPHRDAIARAFCGPVVDIRHAIRGNLHF